MTENNCPGLLPRWPLSGQTSLEGFTRCIKCWQTCYLGDMDIHLAGPIYLSYKGSHTLYDCIICRPALPKFWKQSFITSKFDVELKPLHFQSRWFSLKGNTFFFFKSETFKRRLNTYLFYLALNGFLFMTMTIECTLFSFPLITYLNI